MRLTDVASVLAGREVVARSTQALAGEALGIRLAAFTVVAALLSQPRRPQVVRPL